MKQHTPPRAALAIGRYFNNRLKQVFAGVADAPGVLRNSSNNPLYLFCFAVGNERGTKPALDIVKQWGGKNKKKAGRTLDGQTWNEMPR